MPKMIKVMIESNYPIMTQKVCAKYSKISPSQLGNLYKRVREGKIPAVKIKNIENNKIMDQVLYNHRFNTAKIYTHVSTKDLSAIKNPLDGLLTGGGV